MKIPVEHIIGLLSLPRIGRKTAIKLLNNITYSVTDWQDFIENIQDQLLAMKSYSFSAEEKDRARATGQQVVEDSERHGIRIISYLDSRFPKLLLETDDFPVTISYKGNLDSLNKPNVAIIGTRDPSDFGLRIGQRLGELFADNKFNVVSGLAKGCDAAGHKGAIKGGGTTTAVLAHGLDTVYPKENRELAEDILAHDGLLISEYFVKEKVRPNYFVERDRIQAGLSQSVVVVETDIKGGTMHTVKYTQQYNRKLACVDHPEKYRDHPKAQGNRMLIDERKAYALNTKNEIDLFTYLTLDDYFEHISTEHKKEKNIQIPGRVNRFSDLQSFVEKTLLIFINQENDQNYFTVLSKLTSQISDDINSRVQDTSNTVLRHFITHRDLKPSNDYFKTIILDEVYRNHPSKLEYDFTSEWSKNLANQFVIFDTALDKSETPTVELPEIAEKDVKKNKKKDKNNNNNKNQIGLWEE